MSRYAVIDIGTNSVKLHVAREVHGRVSVLADEAVVTRLGEGMDEDGDLNERAMDRTLEVVKNMVQRADSLGASKIAAVGTAAFRRAANADEFIDMIRKGAKIRVKVITGDEEARLSALAVRRTLDLPDERVVVADIGGGSTEFVVMKGESVLTVSSLPIGVRTLCDKYASHAPLAEDESDALERAIAEALDGHVIEAATLVGVGGTAATLAAIDLEMKVFDPLKIHGYRLKKNVIEDLYDRISMMSLSERRRLPGLPADRADVMPVGAAIVLAFLKASGAAELLVCRCGLRQGVLADRFLQ